MISENDWVERYEVLKAPPLLQKQDFCFHFPICKYFQAQFKLYFFRSIFSFLGRCNV